MQMRSVFLLLWLRNRCVVVGEEKEEKENNSGLFFSVFFLENLENEFSPLQLQASSIDRRTSLSLSLSLSLLMNLKQQLPKGTASHLFTHFSLTRFCLVY